MAECLIGLGSNLGDRAAHLEDACRLLGGHPQIHGSQCSAFHATPPIGGPAGQAPFLNAVLRITTSLPPQQLLTLVRDVEQRLGRQRRERWGPRVIDIDVLLYDQQIEETNALILPHPRMAVRRFVLAPACEVGAEMIHPTTGWTVAELLQRLEQTPHYVAIAGIDTEQTTNLAVAATQVTGAHLLLDPVPPSRPGDRVELGDVELGDVELEDNAAQRELRTITARLAQLLQLPHDQRTASTDWYVCSYWLPQSLAVARTWLDESARQQVEQACTRATRQMPLPHCVVFLATPWTAMEATSGTQAPTAADAWHRARVAALAWELSQQLSQPRQGPVLRIPSGDQSLALTELTAAIDAMR